MHGDDFTHVISGAALTPTHDDERARPASVMEVNTFGTIRALEWARALPVMPRFIYVSSNGIYGPPGLAREALPGEEIPKSMELYAVSKHASEAVVNRWAELFGLEALSVRFSMVYGRLDRDTGARNRHNPPYCAAFCLLPSA
jgi:UDP-glucose 4-epimerase